MTKAQTQGVRITVMLPVRNGMPYLTETLASLEAQTERDWEIIAWDNSSSDGSLEELHRWIPARLPGRIIADKPLTYGKAVGEMLLMARTELCAIAHQDDIHLPERLEKQSAFMDHRPEVALLSARFRRMDSQGVIGEEVTPFYTAHDDLVHYMMLENGFGAPLAMLRRRAVLEVGNHRDNRHVEDYDLWMRLAMRYKVANLPDCLLHYRIHERGGSSVATAAGEMSGAAAQCFVQHAPALFGCSTQEAEKLRARQLVLAAPTFVRIARHLAGTQGGSTLQRLRSVSFLDSARGLLRPGDYLTRFLFALLDKRLSLARHGGRVIRRAFNRFLRG